ncbi:hypothetical protein K435DRAFT_855469 [Dendrothele bispora CBS 962.96]|uniref:Secreted protein n=1 Tax=Dendrothele bispora (strain CBS 962.96) TaxID=1314807 RepID=A0A4S8MCE9_DENBC|nr:hypothetical protein K435DRAFT_855469 [Dendrothele bispora CBS 962.96]
MLFNSLVILATAFSLVSVPVNATFRHSQPSEGATKPFYCPEVSSKNFGKMDWLCDKPPYSNNVFGCTYRTGTGTRSVSCLYDVLTGKCQNESEDCPKSAWDTRTRKRYLSDKPSDHLNKRMHSHL